MVGLHFRANLQRLVDDAGHDDDIRQSTIKAASAMAAPHHCTRRLDYPICAAPWVRYRTAVSHALTQHDLDLHPLHSTVLRKTAPSLTPPELYAPMGLAIGGPHGLAH